MGHLISRHSCSFAFFFALSLSAATAKVSEPSISSFDELNAFNANAKIAYFLGSFDPVHRGHVFMATKLLDDGLVDAVIFYALPVDGKRKSSQAQSIRHDIIEHSLMNLFHARPDLRGRIFYLNMGLASARENLGRVANKYHWVSVLGSDNAVLKKESLHDKYMVRKEYDKNTDVAYDIQASTAITASEFVVFVRGGSENFALPSVIATRPVKTVLTTSHDPYFTLSSTQIRAWAKASDWDHIKDNMWLTESQLLLLSCYQASS